MRRFQKQILAVLSVGAAGVFSATGCVDNNSSLFIEGMLAPEAPDCAVTAEPNSTFLGEGVLDLNFSSEYRGWLLVGNQMTPRGVKQQARTETKRVSLTGAEVTLENAGGEELGAFTIPGTGFVTINRSEEPGYGAFLATLIPAEIGGSLSGGLASAGPTARQTVIAMVRVFGETLGGGEIESGEFSFPIQVCMGCTIIYPLDAVVVDTDANGQTTATCSLATGDATALPCFAGQGPIDCRACSATNSLCRSPSG